MREEAVNFLVRADRSAEAAATLLAARFAEAAMLARAREFLDAAREYLNRTGSTDDET